MPAIALLLASQGCANAPAPAPSTAAPGAWSATASGLGNPGDRFSFDCPPGGTPGTVWGDGAYTADSSVCTAAVHAGEITIANGGRVTVEILPGRSSYSGSTRNGVTTRSYGSWSKTYVFPGAGWIGSLIGTPPATPAPSPTVWTWSTPGAWTPVPNAVPVVGQRETIDCVGNESGSVWGSDTYTADSSPCRAAVHAGVLAPGAAGRITIEYVSGESAYAATTRNGVSSSAWQSYPTSFVFPGAATPAPRSLARAFGDAGLDSALDRTYVSLGADVWEIAVFRNGTALLAKRGTRRRLTVVAKASAMASDPGEARIALSGTMYRYDSGRPVSAPVAAQLVLRPALRGIDVVEESRSLGLGSAPVDFSPDDE